MKKYLTVSLLSISLLTLAGCSSQGNEKPAEMGIAKTSSVKKQKTETSTSSSSSEKVLTDEEKEQKALLKNVESNLERPDDATDDSIKHQASSQAEAIQSDIQAMQSVADGGGLDVGSISSKRFNSTYDHVSEWITYTRLGWTVNQDSIQTTKTSKKGVYQYQLALAKDGKNMAYFVGYMNVYPEETKVDPQFTIQNVYLTSAGKSAYKAAADADPR